MRIFIIFALILTGNTHNIGKSGAFMTASPLLFQTMGIGIINSAPLSKSVKQK